MTEKSYAGYYRHTDGGIYHFVKFVRLASNGSRAVEYQHVWPFPVETWVRELTEWEERFTPVSVAEHEAAQTGDRQAAQEAIILAKVERRAREAAHNVKV